MAAIVLTVPDPWTSNTEDLADLIPKLEPEFRQPGDEDRKNDTILFGSTGTTAGSLRVRRPLAGVSIKPDTHAYCTVVREDGETVNVFNDLGATSDPLTAGKDSLSDEDFGNPQSRFWTDFLLQSVTEQRNEKFQIVETFGEPIAYVFGERPRFLQFQGYLLNTADFNWRAQFWENWEKYFRATRLVERNARMYMGFDDILVSGYPVNAVARESANVQNSITLNFTFLVTSYTNFAMQQVGASQRARQGVQNAGSTTFTSRAAEFVSGGVFSDPSYELASAEDGVLARVIGGDRLRAAESIQEFKDALNFGEDVGFFDILNSPSLRYIKGAKTAIEVMMAHQRRIQNQLAYQGVEEMAAQTPGGTLTLNFWMGFIGNLYKTAFVNGLRVLGLRDEPFDNKWSNLVDHAAQLANPYALASYMGYTASFMTAGALYRGTDKYSLSNMDHDFNMGLVARGQSESFGQQISFRNEATAVQSVGSHTRNLVPAGGISVTSVSDSSGFERPVGELDPSLSTGANSLEDSRTADNSSREILERAAVDRQEEERQVNHGAISVVEDADEVADDGSF